MSRRRALLLALLALALAARVAISLRYARPEPDGTVPNIDQYHSLATSLVEHGSLLRFGKPTASREPLYPIVLASLYKVTGPRFAAVITLNILLGVATVLLAWRLGERLFGETTAFLGAAFLAAHPQVLFYTTKPMRETLQTFLVVAAVNLAVDAARRAELRLSALAGAAGGLIGLVNSALLPGAAALGPGLWWLGRRQGRPLLRHAVVLTVALGAVYSLWPLRNLLVLGRFIPGISAGGPHLYISLVVPDEAAGTPQEPLYIEADPVLRAARSMTDEGYDRSCYEAAFKWMREHPGLFALRICKSFVKLWRIYPYPRDYGMNYGFIKRVSILSDGWMIPLGLVGLVLAWRRYPETAIPNALVAGVVLTYSVFWAVVRYRLPLMPFVLLYAAYALVRLARREG